MSKNILITGGSGLVGKRLSDLLASQGHAVSHLSRSSGQGPYKTYQWDIPKGYIDPKAVETCDAIIHLAGAGVFDKRWTEEYKKEIRTSRIDSTKLLKNYLTTSENKVTSFISASAIGIYGNDTGSEWITEEYPFGKEFLAEVTHHWEQAAASFPNTIRTVNLRIGIVMAENGGALESLAQPIRLGVGAPIGKGSQFVSWIHIDDLCRMFSYALEHAINGIYNAVAPTPETNATVTKLIAKQLHRPLWLPNIPSFAMKLIVGSEQAQILLGGNRVSSEKIQKEGFNFTYTSLESALKNLL